MRLCGYINQDAQERLFRNFLPALDKMGKTVQLMFRPEQVMFVQLHEDGTEGGMVKLELPTEHVFAKTGLVMQSRKDNIIAFSLNVSLLLKIFAAANAIDTESMQMKMSQRDVQLLDGTIGKEPILVFNCSGALHSSSQEILISKPYTGSQVDDLVAQLACAGLQSWYVDIMQHVSKLEALLHTVGRQSQHAHLMCTRAGELHLQIQTDSVVQGLEVRPLSVYPEGQAKPEDAQGATTADKRFLASAAGDASMCPHAEVLTKSLNKALAAAGMTNANMLLLSCGDEGYPAVHLLCVFTENGKTMSDYALHVWLPKREEAED